MAHRIGEYAALADRLGVDAVAVVPGPNFTRMTGKTFHSMERPIVVFAPPEGEPAAIVPRLEMTSFELIGFPGPVFDWRDEDGHAGAFAALARAMPLSRVAVEGQVMRVFVHHAIAAAWPGIEVIDAEAEISGLRAIKTAEEVAALEAAIALSEAALGEVLDEVRPGQTEAEVARRLTRALMSHGAEGLSFGPIVAAAGNAARPHATPRQDYALAPGDALLIDFGGRKGGFAADITRTVFVGHATDAARAVYDTVLRANEAGHAAAGPGVSAHAVDDAVISVLEASPFAHAIRHKTGHGLGRAVHEAPWIMRGNAAVLEPGMVFTNEPGLYLDGVLGVRIEDDVLVTETGTRCLTRFPKELTVVGAG